MSVIKLREMAEKINIRRPPLFDEPLAPRTTFRIGGPADLLLEPETPEEARLIRQICTREHVPVTLLGGGANVLIADSGIRGVTVCTSAMNRREFLLEEGLIRAEAGTPVDTLVREAAQCGMGGLSFLAGLPGTLGGALWMNARCYGSEMSQITLDALVLTEKGSLETIHLSPHHFSYKKSPFQETNQWIISLTLKGEPGQNPEELKRQGRAYREDRKTKGHFRSPSAGSTFKNNRAFGSPSGVIIDQAHLRGLSRGEAQIAPWHGNIFINRGKATARDMRDLIEEVQQKIYRTRGFLLEPEVVFTGDWEENHG